MRHVLRARAEAARALATFFQQLGDSPAEKRVRASVHLARTFGGWVDGESVKQEGDGTLEAVGLGSGPTGWRSAKEVIAFLASKGAKIATLQRGIEAGWAALSSDAEGTPMEESDFNGGDKDEDIVWVAPGH